MLQIKPEVVSEERSFLVLNKPAGWIVNEATTARDTPVLQKWLASNYNYPIAKNRDLRSGIVHRLDKETSGVIVVAKTKESMEAIQSQFKERTVQKTYKALLHGILTPKTGEVNAPVGRLPWNRERFGVLAGGRDALTKYSVDRYYQSAARKEKYSWVVFYPKTGRTHQIRIHAKHLGRPIVADTFYAGRKQSRKDRLWMPHLALVAICIEFENPDTGKRVSYEAAIPKEIKKALRLLEIIETSGVS